VSRGNEKTGRVGGPHQTGVVRISDHARRGMYINISISISSLGCTMSGVVSDYVLIFLLHLKCSAGKVVYWVAYAVRRQ